MHVGSSSRDIRLSAAVDVTGDVVRVPLTLQSTIGEVMADPAAAEGIADHRRHVRCHRRSGCRK